MTAVRDATAFGVLAREHLSRLYALAARLLPEDPEELVQECLVRAFRRFGDLQDEAAAERWLNVILVNCAKDRYRAASRSPEVPVDPVDEFSLFRTIAAADPFPYSDTLHVDFLCRFGPEDVRAVLADLPELYRTPLVLVHMQGYPTKQVAAALDVPLGTLLARLHRGRKLFERRLWDYAQQHDLLKERPR